MYNVHINDVVYFVDKNCLSVYPGKIKHIDFRFASAVINNIEVQFLPPYGDPDGIDVDVFNGWDLGVVLFKREEDAKKKLSEMIDNQSR